MGYHNCLCIEGPSKRNEYKSQDLMWFFKIVRSEIWHGVALEKKVLIIDMSIRNTIMRK